MKTLDIQVSSEKSNKDTHKLKESKSCKSNFKSTEYIH